MPKYWHAFKKPLANFVYLCPFIDKNLIVFECALISFVEKEKF